MKKIFFRFCSLLFAFALFTTPGASAQASIENANNDAVDINKLIAEISQNPDDLGLHEQYLTASGFTKWGAEENPAFIANYKKWMEKYPKSATLPYALGHAYAGKESPKAKPWLLKAVALDPKFDKAYFDLWIDGERWGDFNASRAYLAKAKEVAPQNPDYAFYYANGFDDTDFDLYTKLSLEVARDFPATERGAQALYWLANKTKDKSKKIKYYEQQKKDFPADKFRWTSSGMSEYFNLLLEDSPGKATEFAKEMAAISSDERSVKSWNVNIKTAENIGAAQALLAKGNAAAASAVLDSVAVPRWSSAKEFIMLLKAKALAANGKTQIAYTNVLTAYAKEPVENLKPALLSYGKMLGKKEAEVNKDVWYVRDTTAKQAPVFNLETYLTKGRSSLDDYKGKVVLLTYWFPGCGPCRGEFPHFENVVKNFKGKDFVYLGINIIGDQDDYVVPFMKSSGYSFIPLKDNDEWKKGPLDNRNAAPVNFLIDQEGKIIFSNFRTDGDSEATLDMMIRSLLERKKSA